MSHRLIVLGMVLFLLGLLTGFGMPLYASPRLGLSAHLEGTMNGIFLVVLGLVWPRLALGARALKLAFGLLVYAAFANWGTVTLSAIWGAGGRLMPLAGQGLDGGALREGVIQIGLGSLSVAIVVGVALVIWGLVRGGAQRAS